VEQQTDQLSPLKQALVELRAMRSRVEEVEQRSREPIAIVGIGLRFPGGANDPDSFWRLLESGGDAIVDVPSDRWDAAALFADAPGKMYTRQGGFLEDVDQFAPGFFGIAPREAQRMDPQQRLLLEVSWEALERAGYAPTSLTGSQTGVFFGICNSDYARLLDAETDSLDIYSATGKAFSVAAGRLSYLLGLQGPSVALDTACSSSLVATHLAIQSLRNREIDLALAGGSNLILTPEVNIAFSQAQMMARDDRCKTFDAAADGYVRGEGCGVIVLKRLSDALAAGDTIVAVIRGSAVNQDGRSSSLTAPNGRAQQAVIRAALAAGGLNPRDVDYLEAHGTGTNLGDPIEVNAAAAVLGEGRSDNEPLLMGSVKTNIGHLEGAAGVAGLIKVALSMQHQSIPPHLHLRTPNPSIAWQTLPIAVPTRLTPWTPRGDRRVAGVSSFGFSGTNAHIVLEEAPPGIDKPAAPKRALQPLLLSARTEPELRAACERFRMALGTDPADAPGLADICYTAGSGRAHFEHRVGVAGATVLEIADRLAEYANTGPDTPGVQYGVSDHARTREVAFLFTGHGATYVDMGRRLYDTEPVFAAMLDRCDRAAAQWLEHPLLAALFPDRFPAVPAAGDLLRQMSYAQPALFALQVALSELWQAWGVAPSLVLGHSAGEYAAACVAGIFSVEDGLKLAAARGALLQSLAAEGSMISIRASETRVQAAVAARAGDVSIAAINGPESIVISGRSEPTQAVADELAAEGIEWRKLAIATASHSPLVDAILDDFARTAATINYRAPRLSVVSTLTGHLLAGDEGQTPTYWSDHLRCPVRFAAALEELLTQGADLFVEIGPEPLLLGMAARCVPDGFGTWLPSLRQSRNDSEQMLESFTAAYVHGVEPDWTGIFGDPGQRRRVPLPTYPWQRERYWTDVATPLHPRHRTDEQIAAARRDSVARAAERQSDCGPLDLGAAEYPMRWQAMNRLATAYIQKTLRSDFHLFSRPGERHSVDSILAETGIQPIYRGLIERWLRHLVEDGALHAVPECPGSVSSSIAFSPDLGADDVSEARATLSGVRGLREYLERCGEKLAVVLTGQESPLETLFPDGSFETAEFLYRDWPVARYFNDIARSAIQAFGADQCHPLRVLEIGAGTGGTSATLLPGLAERGNVEYTFSDVSDLFLARAEAQFGQAYPFVRFSLLDVEHEPTAQGYAQGSFDVIVAANAVHATRDLDSALAHVRTLLAPGGMLLLIEGTIHPRWLDVTTGLIAGWQKFEDQWRQDNPLLSTTSWGLALRSAGFEDVLTAPGSSSIAASLGEHAIAAFAPIGLDAAPEAGPTSPHSNARRTNASPEQAIAISPVLAELERALPAEQHELLVGYVRGHVARVMRSRSTDELSEERRLMEVGLDSLMAVELRNRLATGLQLSQKLPATLIFDYPSIGAVATYLETILRPEVPAPTGQPGAGAAPSNAAVVEMSDAEVERLLLAKLEQL
jgi:acyl transferase domain-containing protein/SAM-dependent methyltransferase